MSKNLEPREGFLNRHLNPLPTEKAIMKIITNDIDGETIFLCQWLPENESICDEYIGTAKVIEEKHKGIGFSAWEKNNFEFIYYQIIS